MQFLHSLSINKNPLDHPIYCRMSWIIFKRISPKTHKTCQLDIKLFIVLMFDHDKECCELSRMQDFLFLNSTEAFSKWINTIITQDFLREEQIAKSVHSYIYFTLSVCLSVFLFVPPFDWLKFNIFYTHITFYKIKWTQCRYIPGA